MSKLWCRMGKGHLANALCVVLSRSYSRSFRLRCQGDGAHRKFRAPGSRVCVRANSSDNSGGRTKDYDSNENLFPEDVELREAEEPSVEGTWLLSHLDFDRWCPACSGLSRWTLRDAASGRGVADLRDVKRDSRDVEFYQAG